MPSKLFVDEIRGKFQEHNNTFSENHTIEANYNSMLVGPINLSGTITVEQNAALTVFGEISTTGNLDVSGTLDVR